MAKTDSTKPNKPHKDFPLFAHQRKQWAKKVRGKTIYFGPWDDPQAALDKWLREKDYLLAGKIPPEFDGVTVADICDKYLIAKEDLVKTRELTQRHWDDIKRVTDRVVATFGKNTPVDCLTPDMFRELRHAIASKYSLHRTAKEIQITRSLFKFAYDEQLIDRAVRFGKSFVKPAKRLFRIHKSQNKKLATPAEINTLLDSAELSMKAMIYLAINAGFNNEDCCQVPISSIDFDSHWLDWYRPKTGIERRVMLWPETVLAIENYLEERNKPKSKSNNDILFITKYRNQWVSDAITPRFRKLTDDCNLKRPGLTFTTMRHTFQTIGEESGDYIATKAIMAHVDESISAMYRERNSDDRLIRVTDYVRNWLMGGNDE